MTFPIARQAFLKSGISVGIAAGAADLEDDEIKAAIDFMLASVK